MTSSPGRRRRLIVVTALAIAALVGIALLSRLDVERYRQRIEDHAERALGRDVELGAMAVSLRPFGIRIDQLTVTPHADNDRQPPDERVTAERVYVGARLLPLLSRRLEVTTITIDGLDATIGPPGDPAAADRGVAEPSPAGPTSDSPGDADRSPLHQVTIDAIRIRRSSVTLRGEPDLTLGPFDLTVDDLAPGEPARVELAMAIDRLPGATLGFVGEVGPLDPTSPIAVVGDLTVAQLAVGDGPLTDLAGRVDGALDGPRELISLTELALVVGAARLTLTGTIELDGDEPELDLELTPTTLDARAASALASLVGAPLEVAAGSIAVAGYVSGPPSVGLGAVTGRLELRGLTVAHPAVAAPIEGLHADLELAAGRLDGRDLSLRIGGSDLAGSFSVTGLADPADAQVTFDLTSDTLEAAELEGLLGLDADTKAATTPATDPGPLPRAEGRIRIANAHRDGVVLEDVDARVRFADPVLHVEPLGMRLFGGSFNGRVERNLAAPSFAIDGRAADIDLAAALEAASPGGTNPRGRFTGDIRAESTGADYDALVRNLAGGGTVVVEDGATARVNALKTLSQIAGVFGSSTLASVGELAATAGMPFERLTAEVAIADGVATVERFALRSPALALDGSATYHLVDKRLEGTFRALLSSALSQAMRTESTRAAEMFWDPKQERVLLPFSVAGDPSNPAGSIDWSRAAAGLAGRELSKRIGIDGGDGGLGGIASALLGGGGTPSQADALHPTEEPARALGIELALTSISWKGRFLKGLEVEGRATGAATVDLEVIDASGTRVTRQESIAVSGGGFRAKVDGKRLAIASPPFTIRVTAGGRGGPTVERRVDR